MKVYRVTWYAEHRWPFERAFDSAGMAYDAVLSILRETENDFDWDEGPDQLLADVVELMQEETPRGGCTEICVLPARLYISAREKRPDVEEEAFPTGACADGGTGDSSSGTGDPSATDAAQAHYCVVTPAGSIVHQGTEQDCADYIERMETLGGLEKVGYLSIEREEDTL